MGQASRKNGSDPLEAYFREMSAIPMLTREEETAVAKRMIDGDAAARERLVTANLRFVVKVANDFRGYGIAVKDLIQEGNFGLLKALKKYDPDKGFRFCTYAVWWIRAYIQKYIMASWSLVKLGTTQTQRKLFFKIAAVRAAIERLGASEDELASFLDDLKADRGIVDQMVVRMQREVSLDAPVGDEGGTTFLDMTVGAAVPQDEALETDERNSTLGREVAWALGGLDPRERFIVERRIMSEDPLTLSEIGDRFGFSRERARQVEMRAKAKLKRLLSDRLVRTGIIEQEAT